MRSSLLLFSLCLLLLLAVPSWGGSKGKSTANEPQQITVTALPVAQTPTISPGGYQRDPNKPLAMKQLEKEMRQRQKEAAANRAAARAGLTKPKRTEGGTK